MSCSNGQIPPRPMPMAPALKQAKMLVEVCTKFDELKHFIETKHAIAKNSSEKSVIFSSEVADFLAKVMLHLVGLKWTCTSTIEELLQGKYEATIAPEPFPKFDDKAFVSIEQAAEIFAEAFRSQSITVSVSTFQKDVAVDETAECK